MQNLNKIIQADCLEYLKSLPDGCVNLVLIDPPYNISHAKWDKWKCQKEYVNWLGSVFLECQRVLKDNGSFYFWHNDFQQMAELQHWISQNTRFVFNSMISWVKPNFRPIAWKNKQEGSNLRSWFNIQEYCLYYTFEDSGTGLQKIEEEHIAPLNPFALQLKSLIKEHNFSTIQIAEYGNFYANVNHGGSVSNWVNGKNIPSKEQWNIICNLFKIENKYEELRAEYEELRAEYEELRAEYEELRPRFNIQSGQDYNNVWYSKEDSGNKTNGKLHTCEKPQDLLQKIILTSSNENDIVLDCFAGSGSLAQACLETNRNFLCCERDEGYVKIANDRLENWRQDLERQDKWLNERGVMDFESDVKEEVKPESNQSSLF